MDRVEHTGNAPEVALSAPLAQGGLSFTVADGTGYPTGSAGDYFYIVLDQDTVDEEVVKCESRSSGTFTVLTGGRGASGTSDTAHGEGASVIHGWVAQEADDMNAEVVDLEDRVAGLEVCALFDDAATYGATLSGQTKVTTSSLGTLVLPTAQRLLIVWAASLGWDVVGQTWTVAGGVRLTPLDGGTAEADYVSTARSVNSVAPGQTTMVVTRALTPVLAAGSYAVRAVSKALSGPANGIAFVAPNLTITGAFS